MSQVGHILTENLDFRVHLWTFGAEKTPKSGPFKTEKDAQTLPKQLPNNFEKVQKTTFSTPKWPKITPQIGQKWVTFSLKISIFEVYYRPF